MLPGLATPSFLLALLALLGLLLVLGWSPPIVYAGPLEDPWEHALMVAIPVALLSWEYGAHVLRVTRAAVAETLAQPYVLTAVAKGLPTRRVLLGHALRNAMLPVLTVLGVQFGALLGGALILESIFGLPGIGRGIVPGRPRPRLPRRPEPHHPPRRRRPPRQPRPRHRLRLARPPRLLRPHRRHGGDRMTRLKLPFALSPFPSFPRRREPPPLRHPFALSPLPSFPRRREPPPLRHPFALSPLPSFPRRREPPPLRHPFALSLSKGPTLTAVTA